jgi:peroxiredoxin
MKNQRTLPLLAAALAVFCTASAASAIDPYAGNDPFWVLIHEPAVIAELKLSEAQRKSYGALLDGLDLRFMPLRNKPQEEARAGAEQVIAEARSGLKELLDSQQSRRLNEIRLRQAGIGALSREDVSAALRLTDEQQAAIQEAMDEAAAAISKLTKEAAPGGNESLQAEYTKLQVEQQRKSLAVITPQQKVNLKKLLGDSFPLEKLRQPGFKAPELVDTGHWINSKPLSLESLRGKVTVVHFYASGCINCIHNYPWYRQWHADFNDKGVVLVGIHTPETADEREIANVKKRAADEKLEFPILIDGKNENWNAWGNSMWPSVYLIDKRGYLRDFWAGELKWNGYDGEKEMRKRIEELLAEPDN